MIYHELFQPFINLDLDQVGKLFGTLDSIGKRLLRDLDAVVAFGDDQCVPCYFVFFYKGPVWLFMGFNLDKLYTRIVRIYIVDGVFAYVAYRNTCFAALFPMKVIDIHSRGIRASIGCTPVGCSVLFVLLRLPKAVRDKRVKVKARKRFIIAYF